MRQAKTKVTAPGSKSKASARSEGISLAPPAYGIENLDGLARSNRTGLPDALKSGVESLSGLALDDVRVHYNSARPARLQALAYTQGTDIHVAPGQERHLPHEAWHVVQQAQGRVQPTMQMQSGVQVNDDRGLEHEANIMGAKALQKQSGGAFTFQSLANNRPPVKQVAQLQAGSGVIQRVPIGGVEVILSGSMPQWEQDGLTYHLNLTTDPPHVTCENWPKPGKKKGTTKMQFFFKRSGEGVISNAVSGQRGKKKFSELPQTVQTFVSTHYDAIIAVR